MADLVTMCGRGATVETGTILRHSKELFTEMKKTLYYSRPGLKPTIRPNLAILKTGIHCTSAGFLARLPLHKCIICQKSGWIRPKF